MSKSDDDRSDASGEPADDGASPGDAAWPSSEAVPSGERMATLPEERFPDVDVNEDAARPPPALRPPPPVHPPKVEQPMSATETPIGSLRESLLAGMSQRRTTLHEVGEVAKRLSVFTPGVADARRQVSRVVLSFAVGLTVALLATMAFAGGTWRLVLGILGGTGVAALATFGALYALSRLAARDGAREIPGPALLWVGGAVLVALGITVAFTWSLSQATERLAGRLAIPVVAKPPPPKPSVTKRADAAMKRALHVGVNRGVLYVPPDFASEDGEFDLLIHFHGNVEMVEASVVRAKLNALVLIYNLGEGSGKYSKRFLNPHAFDAMLDATEERAAELGLQSPQLRRVALSSWSAGYGALYHILESRSRADRVDAVLMQDSLHGSYLVTGKVSELSLRPFVRFARRAARGDKLMVVTHSAIETEGYPDTTTTASALLDELGLERTPTSSPEASPPPVELPVVLKAFPEGRRWLHVIDTVEKESFHLYGCDGKTAGDHIAHLAQISETVLPPLAERWSRAGDER